MKNICKKSIVICIILLLIGVGVSSAISVDTESTISNNQIEECRECQEVSKSDLVKVWRLLDKVEVYSKLLLVLSKYHPEVFEDFEELSYMVSTLKTLDLKDELCSIIFDIAVFSWDKYYYYLSKADEHFISLHLIRAFIYYRICDFLRVIFFTSMALAILLQCPPPDIS